jgi:hypothetical protein
MHLKTKNKPHINLCPEFYIWFTVNLELYLYNNPTRFTVYFHPGPPTDDLEEKQIPFATIHLLPPDDGPGTCRGVVMQ